MDDPAKLSGPMPLERAEQELQRLRSTLGETHPATIDALIEHASALHALGRHDEARSQFGLAMEAGTQTLGPRHPKMLLARKHHVELLRMAGLRSRGNDALLSLKLALAEETELLDRNSPEFLEALRRYAADFHQIGRVDAALPYLDRALTFLVASLGEEHVLTLGARSAYADALFSLARYAEALPHHEMALRIVRDNYGATYRKTRLYLLPCIETLMELGRFAEALPHCEHALRLSTSEFGETHPWTQDVRKWHARILAALAGVSASAHGEGDSRLEQFHRVDLEYRLVRDGVATPTCQSKSWFFAIPRARNEEAAWRELLHRMFYDANVTMQRREPGDSGWLALDSCRASALDPAHVLGWDGRTDPATARAYLPWFLSARAVVWEGSACWIVDGLGWYDALSPYDYSELMLDRLLGAGAASADDARSFLDKLYPGKGQAIYEDRAQRIANIEIVRTPAAGAFRKTPGGQPVASGPPSLADLG